MKPLRIAILGCRGIPNHYGGFEQLAQYLSAGLSEAGHEITVYNSHNHPYRDRQWKKVHIVHRYDPEYLLGTAGQFIYDLNCILHARKQYFDVWLFLGYTSSSVWNRVFPKNTLIISNMDGMEWTRAKYAPLTRRFLQYAERMAVESSHYLVADSPVIQSYLKEKYQSNSTYIPYGADTEKETDDNILQQLGLTRHRYVLLIARMEPENNIEPILEGMQSSSTENKFVVIGNTNNGFGQRLKKKFRADDRIIFCGSIFNVSQLEALKRNCSLYFHGHSAGGTNPSLLEAMASRCLICAHHNPFNVAVLGSDAFYFSSAEEAKNRIEANEKTDRTEQMICNNQQKINTLYQWLRVVQEYEQLITSSLNRRPL